MSIPTMGQSMISVSLEESRLASLTTSLLCTVLLSRYPSREINSKILVHTMMNDVLKLPPRLARYEAITAAVSIAINCDTDRTEVELCPLDYIR